MNMMQERQHKYSKMINNSKKKEALNLNIDMKFMDLCCSYATSENKSIHVSAMYNLVKMLNILDTNNFSSNPDMVERYTFCLDALNIRLKDKLSDRDLIIRSVVGLVGNKYPNLDLHSFKELGDNEVVWLERSTGKILDSVYINNHICELDQICKDYINADIDDKPNQAEFIKNQINELVSVFRQHDVDQDNADNEFLLSNPTQTLDNIILRQKSPSAKLKTGMQMINAITNGGFEGSRVYCFFGLPGEGKTITLLNILYQIKKYNSNYVCKDPTKRPVLVLLTMENILRETVLNLYSIVCGQEDMTQFTTEEIINKLAVNGLGFSKDSPIDVYIKYKPIYSVDTNYLYTLTENLADRGMEVIGVVFDYIKRIKSSTCTESDMRYKLGAIINELKNFANAKDIPVITASQINREGAKNVDLLRDNKKRDAITGVGRGMIGESSLIDENTDATIFLIPQEDQEHHKWMGFKITKKRYKLDPAVHTKFIHPFVEDNPIKYKEDVGLCQPLSKESLISDRQMRNQCESIRFKSMNNNSLAEIDSGFNSHTIYEDISPEDEELPDIPVESVAKMTKPVESKEEKLPDPPDDGLTHFMVVDGKWV